MSVSVSGTTRFAAISVCLYALTGPAFALDMSPDLFIDGSCEDVIVWASQPVEVLMADYQERMGDGMAAIMNSASGSTILDMAKSTPVENNWFENNCTFTEAQLAGMGNAHTAYVQYLESLTGQ